ncbi:hypothetical protein [Kitasatospora sp. McL0602]|uniref:hypothetical protein n=1 Tax=Kitasatospora sp. McL0602 TaxID=3439530 RepID=UPI003F8C8F53
MSEQQEYVLRQPEGDPELVLARERLARRQAELLAALVAGAPVPTGFDPAQVRVQARGLAAKRRETVARVAPEPARLLGAAYGPLFQQYAEQHPVAGGHRADARAFAAWALTRPEAAAGHAGLAEWLRPPAPARGRWWQRVQQLTATSRN